MSKEIQKVKNMNESGRSMIEMLGVLAVVGVLSVGGVYGYRTALVKYRSNELLNQVSMRAVSCVAQIDMGNIPPSVGDFGNYEDYSFSVRMNAANAEQFQLTITPAPESAICKNMKGATGPSTPMRDFIGNCDGNDSNIVITFNNDMSTTVYASDYKSSGSCSQAGYEWCELHGKCQPAGTSCECPAGKYLDGSTCKVCAAGTYSSAGATSCTHCPGGSFSPRGATSADACQSCSNDADCTAYCEDYCIGTPGVSKRECDAPDCSCVCICFAADTPITLADGTCKRADEVTYDDELLVWNFDEGKMDVAKPLWLKKPETTSKYNYLKFSDGSVLKTIDQHRIFNCEAGRFTYPMTDETPVGTTTLNAKGEWVKLVEKKVVEEEVVYYNIITNYHINCFAGGVLTSNRFNNLYPIQDLKFVKDNRALVGYDEYAVLPRKWYDGLRLAEQPKEVNRGNDVPHGNSIIDHIQRAYIDKEQK